MTRPGTRAVVLLASIMGAFGCAVGPKYKKPKVDTPAVYRGLRPEEAGKGDTKSFGEQKWWDVFQDEQLKELIKTALQQNYDLRRAGTRILEARASLGITRADQFPTISADASAFN